MAAKKRSTSKQVTREFASDMEKVLGVDDDSLRRAQPPSPNPPPNPPPTKAQQAAAEQTRWKMHVRREALAEERGLKAWFRGAVRFLFGIFDPNPDDRKGGTRRGRLLGMVVALLAIALGAYFLAERPGMTRSVEEQLGGSGSAPREQGSSAGGATKASSAEGEAATKRWLIIKSDNARPQFTIELQGDGPTGPAVWLEPPQGVGTYSWSGEQLEVKLVLKDHKASEGVLFDQHFRLDMTLQPDGGLTGTMYAEDWRYGPDTGLELLGMKPYEATGEPK